jgi:hypothetical protein
MKEPVGPTVSTERAALPTLWIDTAIALKLASDDTDGRCLELQRIVRRLVRAGRLLCPNADQHEEFEGRLLDQAAFRVLEDLSLGLRFRHRKGIFDNLVAAAMKSYVDQRPIIQTNLRTYFHSSDPVEDLRSRTQQRFIISMGLARHPETLAKRNSAKHAGRAETESLRQELVAKRQRYEDQLRIELVGYAHYLVESLRSFEQKFADGTATDWDFMDDLNRLIYLQMWKDFGGTPTGFDGLIQFFTSKHCAALPISRISAQLWADLLTDAKRPIKPSDAMDVDFLSVTMPICHFVVTDKDMENRLKRRSIDQEWSTQVFSLSTIDGLLAQLRTIDLR